MEDSFSVRVERAFGSLSSSSSSSSKYLSSSLWSLTDEEIEKKAWNRDTETPDDADADGASFPSGVDGFFANRESVADEKQPRDFGLKELEDDLQCLDDEAEESDVGQGRGRGRRRGRASGPEEEETDEWEIKDSIGMDCTLDYEEEEDEYDKVAVGEEERGDRIYMHNINDYGIHVSSHHELPTSFREATRDPRANHLAAKLRLKEDAEAAKNDRSSQVSSEVAISTQDDYSSAFDERNHLKLGSDEMVIGAQEGQDNASESGKQVKSILKRKEHHKDSPAKRVRFVPGCKEEDKEDVVMETVSNQQRNSSAVPDYLQNPSKYTHYTFDETNDLDEQSNRQGYMDFLSDLRKSKQLESDEPPADLSQPVIFTPKKKARDTSVADNGNKTEQLKDSVVEDATRKKSFPISMADEDAQENDVCAMEEDSPQMESSRINGRKRTSRQYRSKINEELDESVP